MTKVITYGTYDLLHYGHIRLLERAKALGDYLIVGITSDDYEKTRGKINLQQSLIERIQAVKATGIADKIVVEEYEGQKIDDIKRFDIDVFAIGSDWKGYFDYLSEYCKIIYLPRTEGISSSKIREKKRLTRLGIVGETCFLNKIWKESNFVNGLHVEALCTHNHKIINIDVNNEIIFNPENYSLFLNSVDAVYIRSLPGNHYKQIKQALLAGKHILCESPLTLSKVESNDLFNLALSKNLILMEAIKTAYATAYSRLLLLVKTGKIGEIVMVDSTCTSIRDTSNEDEWNGIYEWGPTALLPIFQIFGINFKDYSIVSHFRESGKDSFVKIDFIYDHGIGSIKVGDGVKSEGTLIISGTKGYIYVPAPWWKTDYFEVRYENPANNKRYFYQLDGEGIRYELVAFTRAIERGNFVPEISKNITLEISEIMGLFRQKENMIII